MPLLNCDTLGTFAADHESVALRMPGRFPRIEAVFLCCYSDAERYVIDVFDVAAGRIDRWSVPRIAFPATQWLSAARRPPRMLPAWAPSLEEYFANFCMKPHVGQLSRHGKLYVSFGNGGNGFCVLVIDTTNGAARYFPDDCQHEPYLYSSTGGFAPDQRSWHFVRWPLEDGIDFCTDLNRRASCQIGTLSLLRDLDDAKIAYRYQLAASDGIHQIIGAADDRYLAFVPFNCRPNLDYPQEECQENPYGYRECHEAGLPDGQLFAVDLHSKRHWETKVATPVLAHIESDPDDATVLYASAHNFGMHSKGAVLEGPAALYKLRLGVEGPVVAGCYCDPHFFRATQHWPFRYGDRTLIAATNIPNKIDLVDAETMSLWRRVTIFPFDTPNFGVTGNAFCPAHPQTCCSANPSVDGRYLLLESSTEFYLYDIDADRVLIGEGVPRSAPPGCKASGHVRLAGF